MALPTTVDTDAKALEAAAGNAVDGDVVGPQHAVLPLTVPAVAPHWATRAETNAVIAQAETVVRLWTALTDPPVHPFPVEAKTAAVL